MKLELSSRVCRNPEMVSGNMDGETVMMSIVRGEYFGLDLIGSRIWEMIKQPVTIEALIEQLLTEYEIDRETCSRDVLDFLEQIQDKGLLLCSDQN
jgi:hypothetical protein